MRLATQYSPTRVLAKFDQFPSQATTSSREHWFHILINLRVTFHRIVYHISTKSGGEPGTAALCGVFVFASTFTLLLSRTPTRLVLALELRRFHHSAFNEIYWGSCLVLSIESIS